jgi:O-antigen/teichoic acid export membrane protein
MILKGLTNKVKSDSTRIITHFKKDGIWVFLGRVFLMVKSFAMSILLTRSLSIENYGEYRLLLSYMGVFALFSLPEASQILIKYVPRGHDNALKALLNQRIKFSIIASLILFCYCGYLFYEGETWNTFFIIALFLPFYYAFNLFHPYLIAKQNFKLLNQLFVLRSLIQLLAVYVGLLFVQNVMIVLVCFIASLSLSNVLFYFIIKKKYFKEISNIRTDERINKFFRKHALLLSLVGVLPIIIENIDKILIANHIDLKSVAVFSIGILLGKAVNSFFKPFISTLSAKLVFNTINKRQYLLILIFGTLFGVITSFILIPKTIIFFYGDKYVESIIFSQVLICSLGIYFFHSLYYNQIMFNKKKSIKTIYINNVVIPLALLLLLYAFMTLECSAKTKLLLISLLYPIRLVLSIILIFSIEKFGLFKKQNAV